MKTVLATHFAVIVAVITYVFVFFFATGDARLTGSTTLSVELLLAAYGLIGIPFIFSGALGVAQKCEQYVRLYMLFLLFTVVIGLAIIAWQLVFTGPCAILPATIGGQGKAFACGIARIIDIITVVFLVGLQLYLLFITWSYCEDLSASRGDGRGLGSLVVDEETFAQKLWQQDPNETILQFGEHMSSEYGSMVAAAKNTHGGSSRIFSGGFHEMAYPPPVKHM